jgi:glycosyltransferase involved in cell wall biosynthesis
MDEKQSSRDLILGIDAVNIQSGGGLTHLIHLLNEYSKNPVYFSQIVIFSSHKTLSNIPKDYCINHCEINKKKGYLDFFLWQIYELPKKLREKNCNILLVPGGTNISSFNPKITMFRNMLPFDNYQIMKFGLSFNMIKFLLLRLVQSYSFKFSSGLVFLNKTASNTIKNKLNVEKKDLSIIPHGLSKRFFKDPKQQFPISNYSANKKYKILYVSNFDIYKNHLKLIKAIKNLKQENKNLNIELNLVGQLKTPYNKKIYKKLLDLISMTNSQFNGLINIRENISYENIHLEYFKADLFVYASSCENMPNILLESMASGLPIACSKYKILEEIIQDAAVYFNAEDEKSIHSSLKKIIYNYELRKTISVKSYILAKKYSWKLSASKLLEFIYITYKKHSNIKN